MPPPRGEWTPFSISHRSTKWIGSQSDSNTDWVSPNLLALPGSLGLNIPWSHIITLAAHHQGSRRFLFCAHLFVEARSMALPETLPCSLKTSLGSFLCFQSSWNSYLMSCRSFLGPLRWFSPLGSHRALHPNFRISQGFWWSPPGLLRDSVLTRGCQAPSWKHASALFTLNPFHSGISRILLLLPLRISYLHSSKSVSSAQCFLEHSSSVYYLHDHQAGRMLTCFSSPTLVPGILWAPFHRPGHLQSLHGEVLVKLFKVLWKQVFHFCIRQLQVFVQCISLITFKGANEKVKGKTFLGEGKPGIHGQALGRWTIDSLCEMFIALMGESPRLSM